MKESASVQKSQSRVLNDEHMEDEEGKDEAVEGDEEDRGGSDGGAEGQDQDAIDKEREEERQRKKEKFYNEVDNEEFF